MGKVKATKDNFITASDVAAMGEDAEVVGVVTATNPYSRENQKLWLQGKESRIRHLCPRCNRGEHSIGFDYPCSLKCECMCKTHYIGRDGFTKIPYGMQDTTKPRDEMEKRLPRDPVIEKLLEETKKRNEENHATNTVSEQPNNN